MVFLYVRKIFWTFRLMMGRSISRISQLSSRLFSLVFSVSKDVIELIGVVEETFPNAMFQVRILSTQAKDHMLLCHLAGRMRVHRVRILPGDRVKVEMTPYDIQKGRVIYRFRSDAILPDLGEDSGQEGPVQEEESSS